VVLGKGDFRFPKRPGREATHGVDLVVEAGQSEGVVYRVVRQHADQGGGWHTEPDHIRGIVRAALERAREAWRENGGAAS
jgi:hypothetical protein